MNSDFSVTSRAERGAIVLGAPPHFIRDEHLRGKSLKSPLLRSSLRLTLRGVTVGRRSAAGGAWRRGQSTHSAATASIESEPTVVAQCPQQRPG